MQKSIKVTIDSSHYDFEISHEILKSFDTNSFYEDYPHVYFKPKDENIEIFASGAIFYCHDYPIIESSFELPCFIIGHDKSMMCDFLKKHAFIPKSWIIKKDDLFHKYEILPREALKRDFKITSTFESTSSDFGIKQIEKIIDLINKGDLSKCVFAQVQKFETSRFLTIDEFRNKPLDGTRFFYKFSPECQFFGATPEWIYTRSKDKILIEAIAGTTPATSPEKLDEPKIVEEFNLVKQGILEDISELLQEGGFSIKDSVITHNHLAHRYNALTGTLSSNITDKDLIHKLHPTAAISGRPKQIAIKTLETLESFKRGFYSSPVGFYTPRSAKIAVGIRSGLQFPLYTLAFSGAGIVTGSIPSEEWRELMLKIFSIKALNC